MENKYNNIIIELRKKGVKVTPQRLAIIEFLESNKIHPSIEQIYEAVSQKFPSISLATVYNTMDMLEEINEVIKLKIQDDNKANYEYFKHPHHHFYCKECGKIYDIEDESEFFTVKEIDGHKVHELHSYFKGICKNCRNKV